MRYLFVTAVALLSWSWAQQYVSPRQTRVFKRNPAIEAITRDAQWVPIRLDEGLSHSSQPARRVTDFGQSLGWLAPSQDADTVPDVPATQPDFALDTLLANNAGTDTDPNTSSDCNHSFFDSLYVKRAWLFYSSRSNGATYFGNYLHGDPRGDTVIYVGGGIAERYDITPPPNSSVYIKGIATRILNNYWATSRDPNNPNFSAGCNTSTGEVSGGPWSNDGAYTIGYQLLDTIHIVYDVSVDENNPDIRDGTYPNEVVAEVTKPLSDVRLGYSSNLGQCVRITASLLELLDYAYFTTPVEISSDPSCKKSFYAAVRYDLYVPGVDAINDTLFGLIGPAYADTSLCWSGDTNFLGRNMVLIPVYRQSTSQFIDPDEWYPQFPLFGQALNMVLFPIIYVAPTQGNCLTLSAPVVRNGSLSFSAPYPNPAVDCLHLNVESPGAGVLQLHLYTAEGRRVRTWNRRIEGGVNTLAVDLDVPAGAYLLQAQSTYGAATFWVNVVK